MARARMKIAVLATVVIAAAATIATTADVAGATTMSGRATYTVSKSGVIQGPAQLPSGALEFVVTGTRGEALQIALPNKGVTRAQIVKDSAAFNKSYKPGAIERDVRFVGGVEVGHSMWVTLPAGRYYLVDTNASNQPLKTVDVLAQPSGLQAPAATQVRAVAAMRFAGSPATLPRTGWLRFSNRASDVHFMELAHLRPGVTIAQVKAAISGKTDPTKITFNGRHDQYYAGVVSQRWGEQVSYTLNPGTYAMLCFWPDENGVPHAAMGMYRLITVK